MLSEFLLVEWCGESKYSVVTREKVVDEVERQKFDFDLIGRDIQVYWGRSKKKHYSASVLQCGTRDNLDYELEQLITQTRAEETRQGRKAKESSTTTANEIETVLGQIANGNDEVVTPTENSPDWKEMYQEMKLRADKYKNKVKTLKRKLKEFEGSDENVDLSPTVFIKRSQLDTIKTVSNSPSIFARNLMRCIFTNEELVGRSLFGRHCNANPTLDVKPSVDGAKRDALILQTLAQFGGNMNGGSHILKPKKNSMLSQIHTSLGDMLREMTRKASGETQN